jgi:1-acyl-sn-glycerol-3-phosphate acyltransferase
MSPLNPFLVLLVFGILLLWLLLRFVRACAAANTVDWGNAGNNYIVGFIVLFCRYVHHFRHEQIPLPAQGGAVLASNHISGLDPFLLIAASPRPLRFMIAREEYERFGLQWLFRRAHCIPVDRERQPERALREALRALAAGDVVAIFPQGGIQVSAQRSGKLKGGVVRLAHKSACPIYPVHVADVRGLGHTVRAVFYPSKATLRSAPVMHCEGQSHSMCLSILAQHLGLVSPPDTVNPSA